MKITSGRIFKSLVATFIFCYIGYGLHRYHEERDVIKVEFEDFNPPIYDFPFSTDSVANAITAISESYHLWLLEKNENLFRFRQNSSNKWISYIYQYRKKKNKRIREYFELLVRLDSLSKDSTRVMVEKYDNEVYYGVKLWKYIETHPVDNPSIHEHEFLRLIGKRLGYLEKIPFTKYPKIFTQKDILILWGNHIPITVEELFEHPKEGLQEWYQQNKRTYDIY